MNYKEYLGIIEQGLNMSLKAEGELGGLSEAMRYSLLAGGKRLRPVLLLEFCKICGGDVYSAVPAALSIEMLHTYSLIHDDLPCMDNDTLRRGKPTNHVVFGECNATLAGDALQAAAFETVLESDLPARARAEAALALSRAAGFRGMCGGQYLDMLYNEGSKDAETLDYINSLKTGALLSCACEMGAICACACPEERAAAKRFGELLGAAFQIEDDILDVTSSDKVLGKNVGSDAQEKKGTYMSLLGKDECSKLINKLTDEAKAVIKKTFKDTEFLENLADSLTVRTY